MPRDVAMASGLDVLCHAIESYTAVPYNERTPRPPTPSARPAYQGANPLSDVWSLHALKVRNLPTSHPKAHNSSGPISPYLAPSWPSLTFAYAVCEPPP